MTDGPGIIPHYGLLSAQRFQSVWRFINRYIFTDMPLNRLEYLLQLPTKIIVVGMII